MLVSRANDIYNARLLLQHNLDNVANWCKGNKLSINIKKTKSMIVGTRFMVKNIGLLLDLKYLANKLTMYININI